MLISLKSSNTHLYLTTRGKFNNRIATLRTMPPIFKMCNTRPIFRKMITKASAKYNWMKAMTISIIAIEFNRIRMDSAIKWPKKNQWWYLETKSTLKWLWNHIRINYQCLHIFRRKSPIIPQITGSWAFNKLLQIILGNSLLKIQIILSRTLIWHQLILTTS